jgi:Ca2+/Na+ antiporter
MNEKVFEKVTQYIDALAAKLGVAAEHVYEVLVRQQVAEGYSLLITWSLMLIIGVLVIVLTLKSGFEYENKHYSWGTEMSFSLNPPNLFKVSVLTAFGILTLVAMLTLLDEGPSAVMKIVNPEYYAIREILNAIK